MRVWAGFLRARIFAIYSHCLTYTHAHGIESNPSQLNDSTFLFFSYSFSFQLFYINGYIQSVFQNVYSSNKIVDIILFGEADRNYSKAKRLHRKIDIRFLDDIQMQIRRILLRERRRIRKKNRKQINAEDDVMICVY